MVHFRNEIQGMIGQTANGAFQCPMCDYQDVNKSKVTDHLAVWHAMLDKLVADYKPPLPPAEIKTPSPEVPKTKKKISLSDYKKQSGHTKPQGKFLCYIEIFSVSISFHLQLINPHRRRSLRNQLKLKQVNVEFVTGKATSKT